MKLKKEYTGTRVYNPLLRTSMVVNEANKEAFRLAGVLHIFELPKKKSNDTKDRKGRAKPTDSNIDRVGESTDS